MPRTVGMVCGANVDFRGWVRLRRRLSRVECPLSLIYRRKPSNRLGPMPVEWALGCFVRFREVDHGAPVTDLGANQTPSS